MQICCSKKRRPEAPGSLCIGDHEVARAVAVRALRELTDEIEQDGAGAVIEWDPILKILVMKKRD